MHYSQPSQSVRCRDQDQERWFWFAVSCFFVGSLMALGLVLAKTPALAALGLGGVFPIALVYHVNFTILLWVSAVAVLLWRDSFAGIWMCVDRIALLIAVVAATMLLLLLFDQPKAVLSNYVPIIDSNVFLGGLVLYVAAVSLIALNRLGAIVRTLRVDPRGAKGVLGLAAMAWLAAVFVLGIAFWRFPHKGEVAAEAELLFWGFGHALQGVNLMLVAAGWLWLSGYRCGYFGARCLQWLMISVFGAVVLLACAYVPESSMYRRLFTEWMRFFSLPVIVLLIVPVWLCSGGNLEGRLVRGSVALFVLGVLLGASIRSDSLMVPAHYHATTGSLNLILMAMVCRLRGRGVVHASMGRPLAWYGIGAAMMVVGLGLSGWMGLGRKLAAVEQGIDGVAQYAALTAMGAGGAIALAACLLFWLRVVRMAGSMPMADKCHRGEVVR